MCRKRNRLHHRVDNCSTQNVSETSVSVTDWTSSRSKKMQLPGARCANAASTTSCHSVDVIWTFRTLSRNSGTIEMSYIELSLRWVLAATDCRNHPARRRSTTSDTIPSSSLEHLKKSHSLNKDKLIAVSNPYDPTIPPTQFFWTKRPVNIGCQREEPLQRWFFNLDAGPLWCWDRPGSHNQKAQHRQHPGKMPNWKM